MIEVENLTEDFEYAVSKFGMPAFGEAASPELLDRYRGRLPDSLLGFWRIAGFGVWQNGYFQFCNPDRYRPVVNMIFGNDKDFSPEVSHCIGFSAFGRLLVWNQGLHVINIDTLFHHVLASDYFKPTPKVSDEIKIGTAVSSIDDSVNDPPDKNGKDMYKRALKASGPLRYGQIYAPKLHPALGGPLEVDNFRAASALEALALSAQAGPFMLRSAILYEVKDVRQIG
jgi:hypothetical protein